MNTSVVLKSAGHCWVAQRIGTAGTKRSSRPAVAATGEVIAPRSSIRSSSSVSSSERGRGSFLTPDSDSPRERTPRAASASCSIRHITRSCFSRPSLHRMAPESGCGVARARERKGARGRWAGGTSRGHLGEHSQATARQQRCCCASCSSSKYAPSRMHKRVSVAPHTPVSRLGGVRARLAP